jgi:hypothetical protein
MKMRLRILIAGLVLVSVAQAQVITEGVHYSELPPDIFKYLLDEDQATEPTIPVDILISYAKPDCETLLQNTRILEGTRPDFVRWKLHAVFYDAQSRSLADMYYAIEELGRSDLHISVLRMMKLTGQPLVVMKSATEVDEEKSIRVQAAMLAEHGVEASAYRKALKAAQASEARKTAREFASRLMDVITSLPAIVVDDRYVTHFKQAGANLAPVIDQLTAMADIERMKSAATASGLLTNLAADPIIGMWHAIVPGFFEVERKSGIWYFNRNGTFGGYARLTDLDTGKWLTPRGGARVAPDRAMSVMRAKIEWANAATVQRRVALHPDELTRNVESHMWAARATRRGFEAIYYLSADGRYHFMNDLHAAKMFAVSGQNRARDSQAVASPDVKLTEGRRGVATSAEEKARNKLALAQIADAETVNYAPAGVSSAVLTVFMDLNCNACRLIHRDRKKLVALGAQLRIVPMTEPLAVNVWCAENRNTALDHAIQDLHSWWPPCAREPRNGFAVHHQKFSIDRVPTIFNARGERVEAYTTPEELLAILR